MYFVANSDGSDDGSGGGVDVAEVSGGWGVKCVMDRWRGKTVS